MIILLPTSAEIDLMKDMREKEYLKTINWLKENVYYKIIFIETVKEKDSFIENYYPVFYSKCHNKNYTNQGSNLGLSLKSFFEKNDFNDDDLIIQTTGRYHFIDSYFFNTLENNKGFDFYGLEREGPGIGQYQYFTGCFALRKKYFEDWLNITNWDNLNSDNINFEKSLYDYIKSKRLSTFILDKINMDCNIFAKGKPDRHLL
jgi:hypothetical protein